MCQVVLFNIYLGWLWGRWNWNGRLDCAVTIGIKHVIGFTGPNDFREWEHVSVSDVIPSFSNCIGLIMGIDRRRPSTFGEVLRRNLNGWT